MALDKFDVELKWLVQQTPSLPRAFALLRAVFTQLLRWGSTRSTRAQ